MIAKRGAAGRFLVMMTGQIGLSVVGTLAATLVVSGLKWAWPVSSSAPSPAVQVTDGAKFAMRAAAAAGSDEPFVTLMALPALLPLFTAPAVPPLDGDADLPALETSSAVPQGGPKVVTRHVVRRIVPRRALAMRRDAEIPSPPSAFTAPVSEPLASPEPGGAWAYTQASYRHALSWGRSLVDHLTP